jgi:hypothetical protein
MLGIRTRVRVTRVVGNLKRVRSLDELRQLEADLLERQRDLLMCACTGDRRLARPARIEELQMLESQLVEVRRELYGGVAAESL